MARPRRTTNQRPQNIGANRNRSMRNNAAVQQNRGTFQSGLSRNQGVAPPGAGQRPVQGGQQCPQGQEPSRDPNTGAQVCRPAQPNMAGNEVPINNPQGTVAPGPSGSAPPRPKRRGGGGY